MKQFLLFISLFLIIGVNSKVQSQNPTSQPVQSKTERKGFTLDVGLSLFFLGTEQANVSNTEFFAGFAINGGYYISHHNLLALELSVLFAGGDQIGTFSYYYDNNPRIYTDGKITRDYVAVPVLATWNYVFDCTEKFHIRLGPSLGFISLSASNSYDPSNIEGLPGSMSDSKALFAFGAGVGVSWDILKRSSINVGYKLIINSAGSFEKETMDLKPVANQLNITWGWRF